MQTLFNLSHWEYIPFIVLAYGFLIWKIAHDFFMWTSGLRIWAEKREENRRKVLL